MRCHFEKTWHLAFYLGIVLDGYGQKGNLGVSGTCPPCQRGPSRSLELF